MSQSAAQPARASAAPAPGKILLLSNRYLPPLFITTILLVGHTFYGILESYEKTAIAIVGALVAELVLGRIFFGRWLNLASAYISGISVGILIRSPAFWPYALCSVISILAPSPSSRASRVPVRRAGITRVSLTTSVSPERSNDGRSRTVLCSHDPSSRTTRSRAASRGATGRRAIRSCGRSKSKSSTRITRRS